LSKPTKTLDQNKGQDNPQFDWLLELLTGCFEEDLIKHRRIEFQSFVDRVRHHPVLSNSDGWKHFLTQTDEKMGPRERGKQNLALLWGSFSFQPYKLQISCMKLRILLIKILMSLT
jgi:hypothetical protein